MSRADHATFPLTGLYAITPDQVIPPEQLASQVGAAIAGGARVIQHRCKRPADRRIEAEMLLAECRQAGIPLIINDDVDLAVSLGAEGVHLGQTDVALEDARRQLGNDAIIGVSCYDSVERAVQAEALGANYVAFGRFFPSLTKPDAPCAHLETLGAARQRLSIPIVAIGGITAKNGQILIAAGAQLLAVIEAVFGAADVKSSAAELRKLFP